MKKSMKRHPTAHITAMQTELERTIRRIDMDQKVDLDWLQTATRTVCTHALEHTAPVDKPAVYDALASLLETLASVEKHLQNHLALPPLKEITELYQKHG